MVALALCAPPLRPATAGTAGEAGEAEALYRRALLDLTHEGVDARREAARRLERATQLSPDSVTYHLTLARLYLRMGFLGQARHRYELVGRLRPDIAEAHLGQGLAWRRDYLKYLDRSSLRRALDEFGEAAHLAPSHAEPWLGMLPLLVEEERLPEALEAAENLGATAPDRADGTLGVAEVAYRMGQVERADSAFRAALPRLPRVVRERYLDIAPLSTEADTAISNHLAPVEREAFLARFWKENDPDLASAVNEAQLEYWSRVTQAYLLYFDSRRRQWDQRGEVYVRYGPPDVAQYNPVGSSLRFQMGAYGVFPMNVLVWSYHGLGMNVPMQDRLLSEYYLPPVSLHHSTDPAPDPDSLALRLGSVATGGGRGVFPLLPPGVRMLPMDAALARFAGEGGQRLLGWLESPGAPGDSLWGEWVVLDSSRTEVARLARPLSASACDAAERRSAEFDSDLPPGTYLVGMTVRGGMAGDGGGPRRGSHRARITIEAPRPDLDLSDVVVCCGPPDVGSPGGASPRVRIAGNPAARVPDAGPLVAYFEAYHLTPGADGLSRIEFEYTVRSAERDPRLWFQRLLAPRPALPNVSATRREEQAGDLRRQFVTVPVKDLPPGRYRLEIRVRDLNAGTEAARAAEFVRGPGRGTSG